MRTRKKMDMVQLSEKTRENDRCIQKEGKNKKAGKSVYTEMAYVVFGEK